VASALWREGRTNGRRVASLVNVSMLEMVRRVAMALMVEAVEVVPCNECNSFRNFLFSGQELRIVWLE
jgi:hypothetical protein